MFKYDLENIGSAVSKHSEHIRGFGFLAKNLAEKPKKLAGIDPQDPQLFGCMSMHFHDILGVNNTLDLHEIYLLQKFT